MGPVAQGQRTRLTLWRCSIRRVVVETPPAPSRRSRRRRIITALGIPLTVVLVYGGSLPSLTDLARGILRADRFTCALAR